MSWVQSLVWILWNELLVHLELCRVLVFAMKNGDDILTRPCESVTESTLQAGIESAIVLLNPESAVEGVSVCHFGMKEDLLPHVVWV